MKGVVFTEFLDFVAASLGPGTVDDIIEDAGLPHGGAYTSVGTYPFTEMARLVGALSHRTGTPSPELLTLFGGHLCRRFVVTFPEFFEGQTCLFTFLDSVDRHIHCEVHKLYPDAELPRFRVIRRDPRAIDLDYRSCRPLESLAEGMIRAAADHFRQPVAIATSRVEAPTGAFVRFSIQHGL